CGRTRQQHVADIGARNQQYEADRAEKDEQGGPNVPHHFLAQRNNLHVLIGAGKLALEATGNASHFGLSLFRSDARLQPGKYTEGTAATISEPRTERQRRPKLGLGRPKGCELEITWHHSDNGVGFTAEGHGP